MSPGKPKETGNLDKKTEENALWQELERVLRSVAEDQKPYRLQILKEIFRAAANLATESSGTLNLKIAATTLRELSYSFKMFYPHRFTPKITMFGSARVEPDSPLYGLAKEFAEEAVRKNYMIITGGGPGIMAAGNEGAQARGGFGLNIILPLEQQPNPFVDVEAMFFQYKYFFVRKLFLVKEASAFAFFPGGFGTFDEAFEVLTLLQTGKTNPIPVVMLEPDGFGYWEKFLDFVQSALVKNGFLGSTDMGLFSVCHDAKEAVRQIVDFYRNYHSMRFVKDQLVIRLKEPLSDGVLDEIEAKFSSILLKGKFVQGSPLPGERNEPELSALTRLIFAFNRRDYVELRRLIDFVNENTV